jgi:sialate O-acetylesterase
MNKLHIQALTALMGLLLLAAGAAADVTLPALFGDHMVLQQNTQVPIWGWAQPGEPIRVKGSWQWLGGADTVADENGQWMVKIKTPKATNEPVSLTITGDNEIILTDILAGEVWVCSGQSNMEYTPARLGDAQNLAAVAESENPHIRLFTVEKKVSVKPEKDCVGSWQHCRPETVKDFSAVGYYYGKKLNKALDVPIGLISSNWGGTVSEAWTRREALEPFERFSETLAYLKDPDAAEAVFKERYTESMARWEQALAEIDLGTRQGWHAETLDETGWQEMEQPKKWSAADNQLKDVDGIVWFRRTTNLPPSWARIDLQLHLGPIDDIDTVWVNGVKIGTTTRDWTVPRVYTIPASALHVGKNTIAVRIIDNQGDGGFAGDNTEAMRIGPVGADVKATATVANTWKYKIGYEGRVPAAPQSVFSIHQNTPTALYNGMIAPLIPFRIAGAIWYQGESNRYDPILYRDLFPALINNWRQDWGQGNFPFYYVQIAPYAYGDQLGSAALCEAQTMTMDAVTNVGMAVTTDIAAERDIHPKNKVDVGDRLARWALAKTYGQKNIDFSGPLYKSKKYKDNTIRLSFHYVDGGLIAKDGQLRDFEIAGIDRKFVPATAVIDGDFVVVSSDEVDHPIEARYGWKDWFEASLFNKAGLPASSFRTDDWPLQ